MHRPKSAFGEIMPQLDTEKLGIQFLKHALFDSVLKTNRPASLARSGPHVLFAIKPAV